MSSSINVPKEYRKYLERLARDLGYLQTRGAGAGSLGSVSALMCAIAKGEVILSQKNGKATSATEISK